MGDILKHKDVKKLPDFLKNGIELHKKIDAFTDAHPKVKEAVDLIREKQGKYAPVVIDIYFDYFLTKNWDKYGHMPLEEFEQYCYTILENGIHYFPESYRDKVNRMIAGRFLRSCITYEGLEFTFKSINRRAKFESNFLTATEEMKAIEPALNDLFNQFFPELKAYVKMECGC